MTFTGKRYIVETVKSEGAVQYRYGAFFLLPGYFPSDPFRLRKPRWSMLNSFGEESEENNMKLKDTGFSAQEIKDMVNKYMVETYERYDFIAERAEGMYIYDEEGNAYLDFYGGVAVNSPGNRNPKVVAAIKDQVDDIVHTFNYPYTIPQALLAKKICDTIGMDKIFYQNSGTEANECMIKMARKYGTDHFGPDRYEIITAKNGFHGRTYGAMSATGQTDNAIQMGFKPMLPGFRYAEFNNLKDFASKITKNTIAIMVEPVQGEGGVIPATQEFLEGLRRLCDEHDMLLLFDEVQTGWGRTGAPMAYMGYGVEPDVVSMAKAMGGGMPIGACCAKENVAKSFTAGTHGSTYGGHALACAAAYASISEILDNHLSENAKEVGNYMQKKLAKLPHVKEVRGRGLLVGCEYDIPIAVDVKHGCLERMALITAIGDNISRMIPPLIVTKKQVDELMLIMEISIRKAAAEYKGMMPKAS